MAVAYADGDNGKRVSPMPLDEHLSIVFWPLLIIGLTQVSPMPLHLTLGITGSLLRLGIEAVFFNEGPAQASAYAMNLSMTLRFGVGVTPKLYFGGAFEGRQCPMIARRLSSFFKLLASYVPAEDAAAYRAACRTWAELLPVLSLTSDSSAEDITAFQAGTARFVDGLCGAFPWLTVTPRLHVLCCPASDFLRRFGSLGRYSEQGLESWHVHLKEKRPQCILLTASWGAACHMSSGRLLAGRRGMMPTTVVPSGHRPRRALGHGSPKPHTTSGRRLGNPWRAARARLRRFC